MESEEVVILGRCLDGHLEHVVLSPILSDLDTLRSGILVSQQTLSRIIYNTLQHYWFYATVSLSRNSSCYIDNSDQCSSMSRSSSEIITVHLYSLLYKVVSVIKNRTIKLCSNNYLQPGTFKEYYNTMIFGLTCLTLNK